MFFPFICMHENIKEETGAAINCMELITANNKLPDKTSRLEKKYILQVPWDSRQESQSANCPVTQVE